MRKCVPVLLVLAILLLCGPLPAQAKNLTYASDYYLQGNDLVNAGQYAEALTAYRTARSMDERFYNEHYGISYQIGWVQNKLGRYEEALREFKIAEKFRPGTVEDFAIYYNEGCVLASLGRDEEALYAFDSALVYGDQNWQVQFARGIVLARMGRDAEAVAAFDASRKASGSNLPLLGSYGEAAATYDRARGITPATADAPALPGGVPQTVYNDAYDNDRDVRQLMKTGRDFLARNQYEDAAVVFERVLAIDSSNYEAMDLQAYSLACMGSYAKAEQMYDHALLYLDYKLHETYYKDVYYGKGWVAARQAKYDEAIRSYDKLFVIDPDIFRAHYDKAWVLARQGDSAGAVREYNRSLAWESPERVESRSYSLLDPPGTYRDAAEAYNRTKTSWSQDAAIAVPAQVIYQTDFSADPGWQTSSPRLYYWDEVNKSYHFSSDSSPGFAEIPVSWNETPFRLEYDITVPHADPGTQVRFGAAQYNNSENDQKQRVRYNAQNLISGEFRSWRANTLRNVKDGDKTFRIFAVDNLRVASDPEYQGMCRINPEAGTATPSFGENRTYHVTLAFDPDRETISARVSDNFHLETYAVCTGMLAKAGRFHYLDRLILVAEPAENAYIEGSIDNVVLSVPAAPGRAVTAAPAASAPVPLPAAGDSGTGIVQAGPSQPPGTRAGQEGLPEILSGPGALVPLVLLMIVLVALFAAADYLVRKYLK